MSDAEHWNAVYGNRPTDQLGWYEAEPSTLDLVIAHSTPQNSVIDIGGGDSHLVDELLERGYNDITVLDLSDVAIQRARSRLGSRAKSVEWLHGDVTKFAPQRTWDLWHDRAVFHFLTSQKQRDAYRAAAVRTLAPNGLLIVATFTLGAPEQCAGLPVCRYSIESLPAAFAPEFELVSVCPIAPGRTGDQRPYIGAVLTRIDT